LALDDNSIVAVFLEPVISALHIGKFFGDLPVTRTKDVHTAEMPGLPLFGLSAHPADNTPIPCSPHFFDWMSFIAYSLLSGMTLCK